MGLKARPSDSECFSLGSKGHKLVLLEQMLRYHGRNSPARHFCPGPFYVGASVGQIQFFCLVRS